MARRPSSSRALPCAIAAVGACFVCHAALSLWSAGQRRPGASFAAPRAARGPGAPLERRAAAGHQRARRAALGAEAPKEEAADREVPSVSAIAAQGLAVLAAVGGVLGATSGAAVALQGVVGLAGLYVIMSVNEYAVHRYYQHCGINKDPTFRWLRRKLQLPNLASSGHIEHHAETLDDMTLDVRPDPILDQDPFRGTAFSWSVSAVMTLEIAIQSYPWLWLCGWSFQASTAALAIAMVLHAAVWQTLHPSMHELPDPPITYGIPGWSLKWLRSTGYFRFLHANHEGHHRVPGAHGNYNVCCPLADHLFGTYVGPIPPKQAQVA